MPCEISFACKYFSTSGDGLYSMYFQKNDSCFNIRRADGNGIHLIPLPLPDDIRFDGLYLRRDPEFTILVVCY